MSEQLKQRDFSYTIGGSEYPPVVAQFSIVLDEEGNQQDTMLTVGLDKGEMFNPTLEAIYTASGELDLKRPSITSSDSNLSFERIKIPENVSGLLPFIDESRKKSNEKFKITKTKEDNEEEFAKKRAEVEKIRTQFIKEQIAEKYPVSIGETGLSIVPTTIVEFPVPQKVTSLAADE